MFYATLKSTVAALPVLLMLTLSQAPAAVAGDAQKPFVTKRGTIDVPAPVRRFATELSQIAGKYPDLAARTSFAEELCEMNPKCFYIKNWTACCCDNGVESTCEAPWPPQ